MPYVSNYRRSRRLTRRFRRFTRKTTKGRKRFSKKKFTKNTANAVAIRGLVIPREVYAKLKCNQLENITSPGNSSVRRLYLGNSATFYPPQGALGAFATPNAIIPAGELYPGGFTDYGSFFDKYRILGSSIRIEGIMTTNSNTSFVRLVMIPIGPNPDVAADAIENMVNQLDAFSFDQLMGYPQAQYRQIGVQTGGVSKFVFKSFRKTKTMLAFKDIRDREEVNTDMPLPDGTLGTRPDAQNLWGWYFRAFNDDATVAQTMKMTVTVKNYVNFNKKRFTQSIAAVA